MTTAEQTDGTKIVADSVAAGLWRSVRRWCEGIRRVSRRQPKRLRLCESLALGDRRFVAVVEFEQSRFLIGGTQGSLVLLAPLLDTGAKEKDGTTQGENIWHEPAAREVTP